MSPSSSPASSFILRALPLLSALVLTGCKAYTPQPIDLDADARAYLSRSAEDESVRRFATRLQDDETPQAGFDLHDGVSLPEAQAVAMVFNADLRLARLRAGVALAGADHAGLWEDPVLGVDLERIISGADKPWIAGGALSLTLPISGRLDAEKTRARADAQAQLHRAAQQEWAVRCELRRAWTDWSAAVMRIAVQKDYITRLDELLVIVDRLEQAGEYTKLDARLFRIERLTAAVDLATLEAKATRSELEVRRLMGLSGSAPVRLVTQITRDSPPMSGQQRLNAMLTNHPELIALKAEYDVAEAAVRKEIRTQYPDLTIGPGGAYDEGDVKALLSLSLPLPLWNRNQRGVAEALAQRDLVREQVRAGFERLAIALDVAQSEHEAAVALRQRIERDLVPAVDEQEADTRRLAAVRLDPLLILDALTRQHDARLRLLDARADETRALIRLEELTGPVSPKSPENQ